MRVLLTSILTLLMFTTVAQQSEIHWMTIEEALAAQKKEPRKIMIDVYTKWCGPCKMMEKNTFSNTDVVQYVNANYYAVKFDAESPDPVTFQGQEYTNPDYVPNKAGRNGVHQLTRAMRVSAYPTVVFLDEDQKMITGVRGMQSPQQIEIYLRFFADDGHKSENTQQAWEDYRDNFKPTFQ
ncbi:MAG: thioredoxin family protein [Flavobacteriales bacterium]|nr:thioredoxin family protein [Flavobacteriales bacterium]